MRKAEIHRISQNLKDFGLDKPVSGVNRHLNLPLVSPRNFLGTHMDFMWRVICECHETLERGDREELVHHPRYTKNDVNTAHHGIQILAKIIKSPQLTTKTDTKNAEKLLHALDKMATLYLDKAITCNASIPKYKAKEDKVWLDFYQACQNANFTLIAQLFPYSDGVLEIETDDLPEEEQLTIRAKALREIFHEAETLHPNNVRAIIGTDPEIGFDPRMIHANRERAKIFMSIWDDIQTMLSKLELAIPISRKHPQFFIHDFVSSPISRDVA